MLEVSVREFFVGVDLPVAEVADKQVSAEAAEVRRSHGQPPRCVQLAMLRDTGDQHSSRVVDVDEPESLPGNLVLGVFILFPVGHENSRADRLNPERRVTRGKTRVNECARSRNEIEVAVEDVDTAVVEVGGIEAVTGRG